MSSEPKPEWSVATVLNQETEAGFSIKLSPTFPSTKGINIFVKLFAGR